MIRSKFFSNKIDNRVNRRINTIHMTLKFYLENTDAITSDAHKLRSFPFTTSSMLETK